MAREIKFRSWVENDRIKNSIYPFMNYRIEFMGGAINDIFATSGQAPLNPLGNKITYMQYTGLKDKNGKEIYEGDVMPVNGRNYVVVYNEEYARYCLQMASGRMFIPSKNSEVIGNIYENPELLEVRHGKGES